MPMPSLARLFRRPGDQMLASVSADSPHQFALVVDANDAERARAALEQHGRDRPGEDVASLRCDDQQPELLQVVSSLSNAHLARHRSLWTLRHAGIPVRDYLVDGLVLDVSDRTVRRTVEDWEQHANHGPARRRLESLAGPDVLDELLRWVLDVGEPARFRRAAAFAVTCVIANEPLGPGADRAIETAALLGGTEPRTELAGVLLDAAKAIAELSGFGLPVSICEERVVPLLAHDAWWIHIPATQILAALPAPRPAPVEAALLEVATEACAAKSRAVWAEAVAEAVGTCNDGPETRAALRGFVDHVDAEVRATAAGALGRWGGRDEAEPIWRRLKNSCSPADAMLVEELLATHGDERDVGLAAELLPSVLGRTSDVVYQPPRGAPLIGFLARHASTPAAAGALDQVSDGFGSLDDELAGWVRANHPELVPG